MHGVFIKIGTWYLVLQCLATFLCNSDADFLFFLQNFLAVLRVLLQDIPGPLHNVFQVGHLETKPQPEDALLKLKGLVELE